MKVTIKDMLGTVIATARKKETKIGLPDYFEKAEAGAIGRALPCADMERLKHQSLTSRIGLQTRRLRKPRL
jgi:hypothetical protein